MKVIDAEVGTEGTAQSVTGSVEYGEGRRGAQRGSV